MTKSLGYRGNESLKRPGQKYEWTPEQIEEYRKCRDDIFYFAENYFKIITNKGLKLIKLRDYQREFITSMKENRFTISCQARQSGKSEAYRVFITHYILFNEHKNVAVLANKRETAMEMLSNIQTSYQNLPLWLQLSITQFNKGSFILENGSRIIATATSKSAARGYRVNILILDEMAFIENWDEFYASVFPVVSEDPDSKIIITSTPNGLNHFYEFWQGAHEKDPKKHNGYYPIFVKWDSVPGRDAVWRDQILRGINYDYALFDAEFNCEFQGSSGTLIAGWALKQLQTDAKVPLANDGKLQFFEYPIKEHDEWDEKEEVLKQMPGNRYALVADVSRGKSLDYSAFSVFDITSVPYKQVCVYRNNQITPRDYADVINSIGRFYNDAWCLIEINDIGEQVGDLLINDLEYENVLCTESAGKGGKKIVFDGKKIDKGIRTTPGVKLSGCLLLKLLIEQGKLIVPDTLTIYELNTFVKEKNTYKAESGKHDDLAMGLVLFSWLTDHRFFKDMTEINTMDHLREKTVEQLHGELSPLGFYEDEPATVYHEFYPVTHDMNNNWNWGNNLREYGDTIQIANF